VDVADAQFVVILPTGINCASEICRKTPRLKSDTNRFTKAQIMTVVSISLFRFSPLSVGTHNSPSPSHHDDFPPPFSASVPSKTFSSAVPFSSLPKTSAMLSPPRIASGAMVSAIFPANALSEKF